MSEHHEKGKYTGVLSVLLIIGAISEGIYEIYHWLRYGIKAGLTVAVVLIDYLHADLTFIYYPTEWVGAAKIVRYITEADLWLFLVCTGLLALWYSSTREP